MVNDMPSCQVSMTITMLGDCVFREATCMFKDNFPHKLMISAEYLYILSMLYRSSFTLQVKWVGYKADRLFIACSYSDPCKDLCYIWIYLGCLHGAVFCMYSRVVVRVPVVQIPLLTKLTSSCDNVLEIRKKFETLWVVWEMKSFDQ